MWLTVHKDIWDLNYIQSIGQYILIWPGWCRSIYPTGMTHIYHVLDKNSLGLIWIFIALLSHVYVPWRKYISVTLTSTFRMLLVIGILDPLLVMGGGYYLSIIITVKCQIILPNNKLLSPTLHWQGTTLVLQCHIFNEDDKIFPGILIDHIFWLSTLYVPTLPEI